MALMRSDVLFKVYGAKCVSSQKVKLRPEEHHYEGADGKEYVKYSCQLCETLAKSYPNKLMNKDKQFRDFSFPQGTKQCPCCGINIDWDYNPNLKERNLI